MVSSEAAANTRSNDAADQVERSTGTKTRNKEKTRRARLPTGPKTKKTKKTRIKNKNQGYRCMEKENMEQSEYLIPTRVCPVSQEASARLPSLLALVS
mmetsp:Transcript_19923/g.49739  ORF Transcript_19923/g.49739 Transcript_19923/m.49739 type:complete len:98 (-) Transcript_19923:181-474(-)